MVPTAEVFLTTLYGFISWDMNTTFVAANHVLNNCFCAVIGRLILHPGINAESKPNQQGKYDQFYYHEMTTFPNDMQLLNKNFVNDFTECKIRKIAGCKIEISY